ncbi:MAG: lipid-A-disaccharide synthase, partial [Terriglobia bacterium]|nr:lipid-A-disaccharide synthase [Terriglobia bacterium]
VLIDFPDVNFRLARELKKLGIPVLYFVSPQLWAWKQYRVRWVRERVSKMLVIFPFEEKYYRQHGVDVEFVGHPLADLPLPSISRQDFANQHGLEASKEWIGLLPGSRAKELRHNLPVMIAAANLLGKSYEYVLPAAATLDPEWIRMMVAQSRTAQHGAGVAIRVVKDARATLYHARASVVASGTATVEAALIGNPFIAVYRLSKFSYAVASRLVDLPHVAMANLIAGKRVVPELIQEEFTAEKVASSLQPLLEESDARLNMLQELAGVRSVLCRGADGGLDGKKMTAIDRASEWVLRFLNGTSCASMATQPEPHMHV